MRHYERSLTNGLVMVHMGFGFSAKTILLINPKWGQEAFFPLELARISSYLQKNNYKIQTCDTDFDSIFNILKTAVLSKTDGIVISVLSYQIKAVVAICKRIKALNSSTPIVLTGKYPSIFAENALNETSADFAVIGDAERTTLQLLNNIFFKHDEPDNIAYFSGSDFIQKGNIYREQNPDELPFADRVLFPVKRYGYSYRSDFYPYAAMKTSDGCNHNCLFCNVPAYCKTKGFIARSPHSVIAEMIELKEKHGVKSIHFEDDAFFSDKLTVETLCKEMLLKKVNIPWELVNGVRPSDVDLSLLPLMAKSGCKHICLGIETLTKGKTSSEYEHTVEEIRKITVIAKQHKMGTTGYFIIGLPNTDYRQNEYTVSESGKLGLDMVHFSVYKAYAGCGFENTRIIEQITESQAEKLASIGYKAFYLSPVQISRMMFEFVKVPAMLPTVLVKTLARFSS